MYYQQQDQKYRSQYNKGWLEGKIYTFNTGYSTTTIVESSRKKAIKKYLHFLQNKALVSSHIGYLPGAYANNNIMGQGP